mmetsp:Transcript_23111/g.50301  ORF Transcript_23111/g.50301 Transcript_23111/m.50301 type:complete len:90 (-) Transcript_23111:142-411(-)
MPGSNRKTSHLCRAHPRVLESTALQNNICVRHIPDTEYYNQSPYILEDIHNVPIYLPFRLYEILKKTHPRACARQSREDRARTWRHFGN